MTESIIARRSNESTNYNVYEAAEPDVPTDDFVQALSGLYVSKDVFEQAGLEEAPEIIEVVLGEDEALTLQPDGESANTRQFTSAHELDGREIICSMYVAHRIFATSEDDGSVSRSDSSQNGNFEESDVPEELGVSLDMSASLEDWEESVEAVEEEFGTVETDDVAEEIDGFLKGAQSSSESEHESEDENHLSDEETDQEEDVDASEAEQELEEMLES